MRSHVFEGRFAFAFVAAAAVVEHDHHRIVGNRFDQFDDFPAADWRRIAARGGYAPQAEFGGNVLDRLLGATVAVRDDYNPDLVCHSFTSCLPGAAFLPQQVADPVGKLFAFADDLLKFRQAGF
jgi:hypothetical protein